MGYPSMSRCGHSGRGTHSVYSLSDDVGIMAGIDLEAAVIRPQVDGDGNACYTSFVDLVKYQHGSMIHGITNALTISAASVPAMENSRSAYFFQ